MRGGDSVSAGAVTLVDFDAVMSRDVIESAPWKVRQKSAGEADGADAPASQLAAGRAAHLCRKKAPVEIRVVRREYMTGDDVEEPRLNFGESRCVLHHRPRNVRELTDESRYGTFRIYQSFKDFDNLFVANDNRGDFGDAIAGVVTGASGLEVNDDI
jgi:hypothetical protein